MTDMPSDEKKEISSIDSNRRAFVTGAAATAGILGAVAMTPALAQAQQAAVVEDPKAPPGLKATPDLRYPLCFKTPVTEGVRVLMDYFTALNQKDAKGMADSMHFPYGTYEGTEYVIVKSADDFLAHAPASMNITDNPERFTDHDGFMKTGSYDVFDGVEVLNSDPISVSMTLAYNRYGPDGKKMLRCEGIYWATNNDGKWALQKASTIFTPADMVGVTYPDAMMAAKRLREDHTLQFMVRQSLPTSVPPFPTWTQGSAAANEAPQHSQTYNRMHSNAGVMSLFKVKGIKSRVPATPPAEENISSPGRPTDYLEYRDTFKSLGLGPYGFDCGTSKDSRIIHHTIDKVHFTACAARYNATGEEFNTDVQLAIATYKMGYWRLSGALGYVMTHDRGNDKV